MHAFMAAVLLRTAGANAFDRDTQPQPPDGKLRELKKPVRRGEGDTVIRADGPRQPPFPEEAFKGPKSQFFAVGFQSLTQQQIARGVVRHRERVTVSFVAELELALVIGRPQVVRMQA